MTPRSTWTVLLVLLALLAVGALAIDRSAWPSLVGDEATYLMQAASLAWGGDLHFDRGDYERFLTHYGQLPEGLILQSGDDGATITFGKPFFYALYLAPIVRLWPANGPYVANVLLLALASVLAARTLQRRLGPVGPLWVALLVFGSVSFAYTFWAHPDLFLMCLVAIALALVLDPRAAHDRRRFEIARWTAAALLVAVAAYSRPMYGAVFLPLVIAAGQGRRLRRTMAMAGGALAVVILAGAIHQSLTGSWTSYGAARRGFYSYTGFPGVDFPATEWRANLEDWGNHRWLKPSEIGRKKLNASLWAWNTLYLLAGRHVGVLPYFLPFVLALARRPRGALAWGLLAAVVLATAAFLWLRPFNFWGGGGALANRYLLPLYPLFWFLPERPIRARYVVAAGAVAGLFVGPLWLAPLSFPLMRDGAYQYVSPAARRWLPYETTQSHLKPSGQEDVLHRGLWIKILDPGVEAEGEGEMLRLRTGRTGAAFLLGSPEPLTSLELELRLAEGATLRVDGGEVEELEPRDGWRRFRVTLGTPRARHPMWWTWEPFYLYRLKLTAGGAQGESVAFRLERSR